MFQSQSSLLELNIEKILLLFEGYCQHVAYLLQTLFLSEIKCSFQRCNNTEPLWVIV